MLKESSTQGFIPTMTTQKATIQNISFLDTSLAVLLMPSGEFRIAVSQVAKLDWIPARPDTVQKWLKGLLGKDFPLVQVASELNSRPVNTLSIPDFERLVTKLAFSGNETAQEWVSASMGLTLTNLCHDAFGVKFEAEERQSWMKARLQGKLARRGFTDKLKDAGATGVDYATATMKLYTALGYDDSYHAHKAAGGKDFRSSLDQTSLLCLERLEDFVARKVAQGKTIEEALKLYF
jgi:hypothetical protein